MLLPSRFIEKVNTDGPVPSHLPHLGQCHIWTAASNHKGYGRFWDGLKPVYAHRYSYEINSGQPIPQDFCVLHKCDTPPCVRYDHLFLGTNAENSTDRHSKGRDDIRYLKRGIILLGERNGRAKLDDAAVAYIRENYVLMSREFGTVALGRRFGVSNALVGLIVRNKNWRT